jgi:hypothetical protein
MKESTTQNAEVNRFCIRRQNGGHGLVQMESAYNAAIVDLSEYIKQGKDSRLVQEYEAGKTKYSLQKEANLINQKYITQETPAQNTKSQHKSSFETRK